MIALTRLTGAQFALNPDLVERVDRTPDTVITLIDGTKYLVRESLEDVVQLVLDFRARVLAAAGELEVTGSVARRSRLTAVPAPVEEPGRTDAPAPGADGVPVLPLAPRQV